MEVDKIVNQVMADFKEEKYLEKLIRKRLEKTMEDVVNSLFRSYSDFSKKLQEQIEKEMVVNLEELTLPEYNALVLNWVKEIVNNHIGDHLKKNIQENLDKFFDPIKKKEWRLSEIIDKFKEDCGGDDENYGTKMSFHCEETRYSSDDEKYMYHIYFDQEDDKDAYQCDFHLFIADGKLSSVKSEKGDLAKSKYKDFYGFDQFLFQLYAGDVTIKVDEGAVDTHFGDW